MRPAVILDMDGTLCDVSSIRYHVNPKDPRFSGKKRFDLFHSGSIDCPPHDRVVNVALMFKALGLALVVVTARKEQWMYHTLLWLDENDIPHDDLFMREDDDNRKDFDVKADILTDIRKSYDPVIAIDDNPAVIDLWKREGIHTLTVPGWERV